jgi:hypothetical protein
VGGGGGGSNVKHRCTVQYVLKGQRNALAYSCKQKSTKEQTTTKLKDNAKLLLSENNIERTNSQNWLKERQHIVFIESHRISII